MDESHHTRETGLKLELARNNLKTEKVRQFIIFKLTLQLHKDDLLTSNSVQTAAY